MGVSKPDDRISTPMKLTDIKCRNAKYNPDGKGNKLYCIFRLMIIFTIFYCSSPVTAQFTGSQQKKDWFYLQTLGKQAGEMHACSLMFSMTEGQDERFKKASQNATKLNDELVDEIHKYINTYSSTKNAGESLNSFIHRIWSVPTKQPSAVS